MTYVYSFEVAAIFISLAVWVSLFQQKIISTKTVHLFSLLNSLVLWSGLFDLISIVLLFYPQNHPAWLHYLVNVCYQISFHCVPITFYYCMFFFTEKNSPISIKAHFLEGLPFLVTFIFDVTNPFTHLVFYFDANHNYQQGPLIIIGYISALFYIIHSLVRVIKFKSHFTFDNIIVVVFFTLASTISALVHFLFPSLMIMDFVVAISVLLGFLSLDNPQDYLDKEMNIYNRSAFITLFPDLLKKEKNLRLLGIKIEEMKYLNDTIGVHNRITLMKSLSALLQQVCNKKSIFRISRSKLTILLSQDDEEMQSQIKKICDIFLSPIKYGNLEISLSIYLDLVKCPEDATTVEEAIDLIENSFTDTISAEKILVEKANKSILEQRKREHKILLIIEQALNNNEFQVVYQPIYSLHKKDYTAAEALLRLHSKELGEIGPAEFIPLAEKNGLVLKIGQFVFKKVCQFVSENHLWDVGIQCIHINLSVIQCMQERLHEQLFHIMDTYHLDYRYITLEVTENTANASHQVLKNNMNIMLKRDIKFSLDDFGIGFSNSSSLIDYPFNSIKLDKSLIWEAIKNEKAKIILKQTISMIKELNMQVIAEGVENKEQVDLATELGCDYIQGFFYSYPLSESDLLTFMM